MICGATATGRADADVVGAARTEAAADAEETADVLVADGTTIVGDAVVVAVAVDVDGSIVGFGEVVGRSIVYRPATNPPPKKTTAMTT